MLSRLHTESQNAYMLTDKVPVFLSHQADMDMHTHHGRYAHLAVDRVTVSVLRQVDIANVRTHFPAYLYALLRTSCSRSLARTWSWTRSWRPSLTASSRSAPSSASLLRPCPNPRTRASRLWTSTRARGSPSFPTALRPSPRSLRVEVAQRDRWRGGRRPRVAMAHLSLPLLTRAWDWVGRAHTRALLCPSPGLRLLHLVGLVVVTSTSAGANHIIPAGSARRCRDPRPSLPVRGAHQTTPPHAPAALGWVRLLLPGGVRRILGRLGRWGMVRCPPFSRTHSPRMRGRARRCAGCRV